MESQYWIEMMDRNELALVLFLGFFLDLLLGDPHWLYHPVRLCGLLIDGLERIFRRIARNRERELFLCGILLAVMVCGITVFFVWGIIKAAGAISPALKRAVSVALCYQLLAVRSLRAESMKVCSALKRGDLEGARRAVSMIVGRDTDRLSETGIAKAAVETVAENTSDGVVAPIFYMAIGGPVLGWFYKAVNTMDSMVGYKNEKYLYFGRAAAKLDDCLNFIPSRLSAVLMILASWLLRMDWRQAVRIFKRDRLNHASPNSAQTESVCAGALRVQLAGDAYYFGTLYKKKTIGDPVRPVEAEDIQRAGRLLSVTSYLAMILAVLFQRIL